MDLVRSWLGQALRATGAAIVVPAAILVALSVAAFGGGGLGGVGSLSQVVSGPRIPGSAVAGDDGASEITDAVSELASSDPAGGAGSSTGDASTGGAGPNAPADRNGRKQPRDRRGDPNGPDRGPDGPRPPGPAEPPPPPTPPPPAQPRLVDRIGQDVKDAGSRTPLAPTIEDAVDGLLDTCVLIGCPYRAWVRSPARPLSRPRRKPRRRGGESAARASRRAP